MALHDLDRLESQLEKNMWVPVRFMGKKNNAWGLDPGEIRIVEELFPTTDGIAWVSLSTPTGGRIEWVPTSLLDFVNPWAAKDTRFAEVC